LEALIGHAWCGGVSACVRFAESGSWIWSCTSVPPNPPAGAAKLAAYWPNNAMVGGGALPVGGGGGGEPETGTTLISASVSVAPVFRPKKANVVLVPVAVTSKVYGTNVVVRLLVSEKIVVEPNVT